MPCMATYIKPSTCKAGITGKLYIRHRKTRDRSVVSNMHLNRNDSIRMVFFLLLQGARLIREKIALV